MDFLQDFLYLPEEVTTTALQPGKAEGTQTGIKQMKLKQLLVFEDVGAISIKT